ncbi:pyridoxamine 5'-phosphate oxidase [Thermoflavifilum thermophilum]|uniref:Pyridoxine/pyridoxamine 5'-phosphate oxidase n=1 Tax=Thermoflavifilum thermophilum TaxID=1393122 RepID=A0A1I7N8Y4_9BACT|nr:pyridoxamine 5'-phosphate oxidase [Thermoflavifilum thermophilum]SFV31115.1 Pyridoxamine 5'-phosphate oxidase [Thermoflavifilum thermophilum]
MHISDLRREYSRAALDETQIADNPFVQFKNWFQQALESHILDANAMVLATCGEDGQPSARVVLLKEFDERGMVFYTHYESRKARNLATNPRAALLFYWRELERQVRIEGQVEKLTAKENETYFLSRPFESQISAWASPQSQPVPDRATLEAAVEAYRKQFQHEPVSCPPFWGGYRLIPHYFEFWQGREHRLHDRIIYQKSGGKWTIGRLAP